jgi:hypothetical protein
MKDLYSILEDALTYQGHSEICGCSEGHDEWPITVVLDERQAGRLLRLLTTREETP